MRTPTAQVIYDAAKLVNSVDQVLANTMFESQLSAKDCYDMAYKLELAMGSLMVAGNRKRQESINADARAIA